MLPRGLAVSPNDTVPMIVASQLFRSLTDPALRTLEPEFSYVTVKSGETLFSAGDPGDALYVVVFGRLRAVISDGPDGDQVLGEIGRGESVGEMGLLTGEPRSATVYAIRDTQLLKFSKAAFERLAERQPDLMFELARLIIARYQRVIHPSAKTHPVALAVVPLHAGVPVDDFTSGLVRALSGGSRVLLLTHERLRRERGGQDALDFDSPDLGNWLHEQELQHDRVLYIADPQPSPWTRLSVRQADLVLFVGSNTGSTPALDPQLAEFTRSTQTAAGARRELVLLYDSSRGLPSGTAKWLEAIAVIAHHHVDPRLTRDYERLARMLSGRAIGLVLGGGGARGLAHIGLIRALEEAGIPIDLVGGTSIGAIIGGQLASGWNSERILSQSRRVLVDDGSLNDYTVPVMALLHGRRFFRMLEKLFGNRRIEDLPLPYYCVSTNLTQSCCMVHDAGPMCKWIAASMAVPGLGPPIFSGRDILVDGGVVNNLPVDVMRRLGRGPVFASSVSPHADLCLDREYPDIPSPWRVLVSWFNPFGSPMLVPSIASILMRTVSLQGIRSGERGLDGADLVFEPPCQGHKLLDWQALDTIMDAGYRTAVPLIEQWQARRHAASADAVASTLSAGGADSRTQELTGS
jgi:NTE family protein